jgi:hypothetical protein
MQLDGLRATLKLDVHLVLEAVFLVVWQIHFGAGFEVGGAAFFVCL